MAARDPLTMAAALLDRLPPGRRKRLAMAVQLLQPGRPVRGPAADRPAAEAAFLAAAATLARLGLSEADLIDLLTDEAACLDRSHARRMCHAPT